MAGHERKGVVVDPVLVKLIAWIGGILLGFASVVVAGAGYAIWNNSTQINKVVDKQVLDGKQWDKMRRMEGRIGTLETKQAWVEGYRAGKGNNE